MDQFKKKLHEKNAEIAKLKQSIGRLERELKAEQDKNKQLSNGNRILNNSCKRMHEELERLRIVRDGFIAQTDMISGLQKQIRHLNNELGVLRAKFD